ncbi:hypothetical protein D5S18_06195 [Nocardia panacis]|uniref:DUF6779 domain-containing protein n=1 Tax=Nocardia panacis TaxID=2340916 RepID=A0A3A4KQC7_9NOCA|nr:DUF6779 domain-containing protein [Nocardia panacis]RJO77885.1 hypothetical protein D5S18_06195 [Nocardia panacis]
MVSPSRSSTSPRRRESAGKFVIGVLVLLGLVASVFLVFSNSLQFVRIGLVVALWAAAIGGLIATKYRKEASADKAKAADLRTVYELQLEREVTARREYELGVESRVRQQVGADAAEIAALRAELTVLRTSLQRLFDGEMPVDRPALRADSTRIHQLPQGRDNSSADAGSRPDSGLQQMPGSAVPVFEGDDAARPAFASPFDEPITAETAAVTLEPAGVAPTIGASDPAGWPDAFTEVGPEPEPPKPTPTMGTAGSRRRRRDLDSGDTSTRLSVAEIMANLQSEQRGRS